MSESCHGTFDLIDILLSWRVFFGKNILDFFPNYFHFQTVKLSFVLASIK